MSDVIAFHPCTTICLSGCTQSGKSSFVYKILQNLTEMFKEDIPKKVLYCYSIWQPLFQQMEQLSVDITFHQGLPSSDTIEDFTDGSLHTCLIMDDLIQDIVSSKDAQIIFTQTAHHRKMTVIYITQNMFMQGRSGRTISLNTHVMVLFRNLRDQSQIMCLGRQLFPRKSHALTEAYTDAVQHKQYGYLVVDMSPHSHDDLRLRTNIFPGEETVIYTLK